MRVLILEDDEPTRRLYADCIVESGREVVACCSTPDAISALRCLHIDLIIVDLMIENTNSLGVVQFAGYAAPEAEVIMITGSKYFAKGELLSDFPGITWVLRKPISVGDFMAFVDFAEKRTFEPSLSFGT